MSFEPWTYPSSLYYRIPVPPHAPDESMDLTSVLHHSLREARKKREGAHAAAPYRTTTGKHAFPLAMGYKASKSQQHREDAARVAAEQRAWEQKQQAQRERGMQRGAELVSGRMTSSMSAQVLPTTAQIGLSTTDISSTRIDSGTQRSGSTVGVGGFSNPRMSRSMLPASAVSSTQPMCTARPPEEHTYAELSMNRPAVHRHEQQRKTRAKSKEAAQGAHVGDVSIAAQRGGNDVSGKGLVRSYMRDAWAETAADDANANAGDSGSRGVAGTSSLATGDANARGGPQAAVRARAQNKARGQRSGRNPHAERWKRVNRAADEARARARKLDLEQQKEPCQATRRKAIVAALQYNEKLVELRAASESEATVHTNSDSDGVGVTGGKRVSRASRPPPPDIREMMDVVRVMCDQVAELLTELEGACRAQPESDLEASAGADAAASAFARTGGAQGAEAREMHKEMVGVVRDIAIELRRRMHKTLEIDSIDASWAELHQRARKVAVLACKAEKTLFYFEQHTRFLALRRELGTGPSAAAALGNTAASELPPALKPRVMKTARELELLKMRSSHESRMDAYFRQVNPEVIHADQEKRRFEKMNPSQREAAALRAMSQQFTQSGGAGAGRMGAASEQVLRNFIQNMTDQYDQNWNVGEYVKRESEQRT